MTIFSILKFFVKVVAQNWRKSLSLYTMTVEVVSSYKNGR